MSTTSVTGSGRPGFVWAAPALAFFALFALLPMLAVVVLSFTAYDGLSAPRWTGLDNWVRLGSDPLFTESLRLSFVLTGVSWVVQTAVALPLGVWLAGRGRSRAVLAALFFVPLLMSSAAIAVLWGTLFDPNFGLASVLGPLVGIDDGNIIGSNRYAFAAVIAVIAWQYMPFHTLLYQAAARAIPAQLYEAALIDGAGRWRTFVSITVPQLRDTIITSGVLIVVGSMTTFEVVLILTGGGPGTASRILPLHMYLEGFRSFDMGYASALAVVLLVLGTTLSLVIARVTGYRRMTSQREGM
ncbi:carbohydrate ABC transporter permease [Pseudonocardia alni]|jgi:xylobiose transport system permease protein|uniref:carbohydrate ABC transporter permease n=1 Tax=Pseudonocardia TaxID=1847 RepID=UPI00091FFF53|nr:sugar ABC transporter permease [Pseudonocardia sp. SID8383]MYW71676.1 ABC transporter permease subunit [Pseudonocardia sp. SID8383]OJG06725.1 Lactose transport system permease protein LacF [Pseudonocardia autotrophica]